MIDPPIAFLAENRYNLSIVSARTIITIGLLLLSLSAGLLAFSASTEDEMEQALTLVIARFCGLGSFGVGVFALSQSRFTLGGIILLVSVILPFISLSIMGKM